MGKNNDDDANNNVVQQTKTNTSPTHYATKKPLTPTRDHPLMDLVNAKKPKGEFMDDSDDSSVEQDDAVVDVITDNQKIMSDESSIDNIKKTNNLEINHISPENATENLNQQATVSTESAQNIDDERNNNNTRPTDMNESDEEMTTDKQKLAPEKVVVVRRKKSPSRANNNNNTNIKNNNRMSYPITRDRSQSRIEDVMTKSSDKIDGKCL
jgi:hypothetical protein